MTWRVVKIENGIVAQEYWDVATLGEFANKYGLSSPDYISTQHPLARVGNRFLGGSSFAERLPNAPTARDVDEERDRRIVAGRSITIGGKTIAARGAARDRENMIGLSTMAMSMIASGNEAMTMHFRDEDNVIHTLTWAEMAQLAATAMAYVSACFAAAWALKDNPAGIPADFRGDQYWPATT